MGTVSVEAMITHPRVRGGEDRGRKGPGTLRSSPPFLCPELPVSDAMKLLIAGIIGGLIVGTKGAILVSLATVIQHAFGGH